jgi:probable F420-dependent oxidoreductase
MANLPANELRQAVAGIEAAGFGTIWIGEAIGREAMSASALILSATSKATVATGIANIYARDPMAMVNGARTLNEAWGSRFVLGIGVSHAPMVGDRGHHYDRPVSAMRGYLDAMEKAPWRLKVQTEMPPIVLAALGPKMMELARERSAGAHPYFVPVEHTREARAILGSDRLLAPEVAVVFAGSREEARQAGDRYMKTYLELDNYRRNLERLGWRADDLKIPGSDRLFDAMVAWGGPEKIAESVRQHLDAGADHIAVQVLTATPQVAPVDQLRGLAPLVL